MSTATLALVCTGCAATAALLVCDECDCALCETCAEGEGDGHG